MPYARSAYMEWAKRRPVPEIDLAGSNLLACTLEDLPGAREALEVSGESPDGYPPLLQAIASRYGVRAENVATAGGCSGANFLALAAVLGPGDEALFESPGYDPLAAAAEMLGARVTRFERRFEEDWRLDPERIEDALTSRTRVVVLSSPHNPSGALASREVLSAIGRMAERRGLAVLADEVYLDAVVGQRPPPAATLSPAFISTNSLTKAYGLSALRCGWSLASAEITERIRRARDVVDVSGPIPAERLAVYAFQNLSRLAERAQRLIERNSALAAAFLASRAELQSVPSATTLVFPRFADGRNAEPFVRRLFEVQDVAVAPGLFFGAPSHFRIGLGGATDRLEAGLDAIASCLGR